MPASSSRAGSSRGATLDTDQTRRRSTPGPADASIVQVVQSLGKGGLEAMAANLAIALHHRGLRSTIVSLGEGGVLEQPLAAAGVPYHLLGDGRWRNPRTHAQLTRLFRSSGAHVAHTHHFAALLTAALPAAIARVPRTVHTEHAFQYLEPSRTLRSTLGVLSRTTDRFVVVGDEMRDYYRTAVGVDDRRLMVIRNGVDTARYRPHDDVAAARRKLGLPDTILVGSAGRLEPVKNYPLLLRATARARQLAPTLHLVLMGDGGERDALAQLATDLGLQDAVSFLGWRTDANDVMAALDLFALTSISEGLPLGVLEAMACAVPVVTTAVGDLPRVVHPDVGVTIPSHDETALADALVGLARDPARRRHMGHRARELVLATYSQQAMVDAYLAAYDLAGPQ